MLAAIQFRIISRLQIENQRIQTQASIISSDVLHERETCLSP
jgi:hypothetical protein